MTRELKGVNWGRQAMSRSVCVIVPSVANAVELGITLDGLLSQTYYGPLEIVVVGPGSDSGREQAESRGVRFIDDAASRTRGDACNVALEATESDLVMFTDDDVIVPKEWVANLARWFERPGVAGVGGPNFAPDRKSTRLNSSHALISYAVFCLKKKNLNSSHNPISYALYTLISACI